MRLPSVLAAVCLARLGASYAVIPGAFIPQLSTGPAPTGTDDCLSKGVATLIVNSFVSLLTSFSPLVANNLLAPNFVDISQSINWIAQLPLNGSTFGSPGAFIGGQEAQPPVTLDILSVDAVACNGVIAFRWAAGVGAAIGSKNPQNVKGITVLYTAYNGGSKGNKTAVGPSGWQLTNVFSEFNSASWAIALGATCTPPVQQSS